MKYYTLQVTLNDDQRHEFKDIEHTDIAATRQRLWTIGIMVQSAPGSYQLFSPLQIREAFLILQDRKFAS